MKSSKKTPIILVCCILASYFFIPYELFWDKIDRFSFLKLNSSLALGQGVQVFWAFLNHKYHDWVVDLVFMSFFVYYIYKPNHKTKKEKTFECILVALTIFFVIFGINKIIFRDFFNIDSLSPSLKCNDYLRLNRLVPFLRTKSHSLSSYPGDHATTALLFYFLCSYLFSKGMKKVLLAYVILISTPRLIIGAHNLSDILAGSMPIAFFSALLVHKSHLFDSLSSKLTSIFKKNTDTLLNK
jgi:Kdo2-lipid A phosphotransferase